MHIGCGSSVCRPEAFRLRKKFLTWQVSGNHGDEFYWMAPCGGVICTTSLHCLDGKTCCERLSPWKDGGRWKKGHRRITLRGKLVRTRLSRTVFPGRSSIWKNDVSCHVIAFKKHRTPLPQSGT